MLCSLFHLSLRKTSKTRRGLTAGQTAGLTAVSVATLLFSEVLLNIIYFYLHLYQKKFRSFILIFSSFGYIRCRSYKKTTKTSTTSGRRISKFTLLCVSFRKVFSTSGRVNSLLGRLPKWQMKQATTHRFSSKNVV